MVTDTIMPPVHPGEILLTEFLAGLGCLSTETGAA